MITQEDLLKEISIEELTQLSDLDATGALVPAVVEDAIGDAIGFIGSWIDVPADPSPFLKELAVELASDALRKRNRLGDEDDRSKRKDTIIGYLRRMKSKSMPSTSTQTASGLKSQAYRHARRMPLTKGYR